jgi:hypothetical protein
VYNLKQEEFDMFVQSHPVYQMLRGNGEQNPRKIRLSESADRLTLLIEGVFIDDGVHRNRTPRKADVPFKLLVSQPLDDSDWQYINGRLFGALERGESIIEMNLTFPLFEVIR